MNALNVVLGACTVMILTTVNPALITFTLIHLDIAENA
jgi:hypothetical protein